MTDLPDPLDELASAHLDGATTPEEAARVAADPALQARVTELRAARDALQAAEAPIDPARRDAAIAAAVAAFHDAGAVDASPPTRVTSLAEVAARRRSRGLAVRVLGAAAILLLVALLVPLFAGQGRDAAETADAAREDADLQETAGDAADDGSAAPVQPEGEVDSGGGVGPTTSTAFDAWSDLGAFADLDALADAVRGEPAALAPLSRADANALRCPEPLPTNDSSPTAFAARASVAGEPVEVVVSGEPGARTMTVRRTASCTVLTTRDL